MAGSDEDKVLLEFQRIGNSVKVTVVDPVSLFEVSVVGSASASEQMLRRTAINKLKYVLDKKRGAR